MEYKLNLTDEEEKLFLQVVGTRLEHVQKTLSDMEEDVQNDKTDNLKKLQDEFRTHAVPRTMGCQFVRRLLRTCVSGGREWRLRRAVTGQV